MIIICHYGEIGLKGDNRSYFEKKLMENIRFQLGRAATDSFGNVTKISGRIVVDLKSDDAHTVARVKTALADVFGIVYFSFAQECAQEISAMTKAAMAMMRDMEFDSFRVSTHRSNKHFPLSSKKINEEVGGAIFHGLKKKVSLDDPDATCHIEIVDNRAFVYAEKISGPGGMPVGSSGPALVLLSGGIDSPVAAYYALKRGAPVAFLHFHSMPFTSPSSVEKVRDLARIVAKYQKRTTVFMAPLADAQKEIMMNAPAHLRVILYRRMMMRVAQKLAKKHGYHALVTGDSLGQVASQTIENIATVEEAVKIPVLRPLIGLDKEEIMAVARRIGTFETSIIPHDDCCTRFMPKNPATKARVDETKNAEKGFPRVRIEGRIISKTEIESL